MNIDTSKTIYVGNIQSIDDNALREYFQRFGEIKAIFHNCSRTVDEWLVDYRFICFSSDTDINIFLTNKIDHTICRICLDIHSYDSVFNNETRLLSDRKICIAHTNPKLVRNVIKKVNKVQYIFLKKRKLSFAHIFKAFTKYGRILNCTCVSSGNGVEYVYIEFDSVNSIQSIVSSGQNHFVGRTSLAVKQPLRPSQAGTKLESNQLSTNNNNNDWYRKYNINTFKYSYPEARIDVKRDLTSNLCQSTSSASILCCNQRTDPNSSEANTTAISSDSPR